MKFAGARALGEAERAALREDRRWEWSRTAIAAPRRWSSARPVRSSALRGPSDDRVWSLPIAILTPWRFQDVEVPPAAPPCACARTSGVAFRTAFCSDGRDHRSCPGVRRAGRRPPKCDRCPAPFALMRSASSQNPGRCAMRSARGHRDVEVALRSRVPTPGGDRRAPCLRRYGCERLGPRPWRSLSGRGRPATRSSE